MTELIGSTEPFLVTYMIGILSKFTAAFIVYGLNKSGSINLSEKEVFFCVLKYKKGNEATFLLFFSQSTINY